MATATAIPHIAGSESILTAEIHALDQSRRRLDYANQFHEIWLGLACLEVAFCRWFLHIPIAYTTLGLPVLGFLVSLGFPYLTRYARNVRQLRHWATFYIALEIAMITLLVHGLGIFSVAWVFYLLSIQYGYYILPQKNAHVLTLLAMAAYGLLSVYARDNSLPVLTPGMASYAGSVGMRLAVFGFFALANRRISATLSARSEALDVANHALRQSGQALRRQQNNLELEVRSRTEDLARAYENLRHMNEHLRRMNRLQTSFIASVSHELRTPLTSIRSFTELLRDYPDETPATQREFLEVILAESRRLERLICDLLDLATLETGGMRFHFAPLDLKELLLAAADLMRSLFARKRLELRLEIADDLPCISGDRDRLLQVLTNLLHNALKFTERGMVRLGAISHGDAVEFFISDTGSGVPASETERIFDRFHQGNDSLTDKPGGVGLGLSICRQIIEHHGGRIWVESQIGHGSHFRCLLPLVQPASPPVRPVQAVRGEPSPAWTTQSS